MTETRAHYPARGAIVTGAASGIGRAIARSLFAEGNQVALVDRDAGALATLGAELTNAVALALDISDAKAVDGLLDTLPEDFAPIHTLVNAAGHDPGGTTRFERGDPDDWSSAIETNLSATMRVTRAVLPDMIERNRGDVVTISSIAAQRIVPEMAAYTASKAGLHAFCDVLRAELVDSAVRVIEIMPGLTQTDLIRKRYRGDAARAAAYYERFGLALEPEDVARTVQFALDAPPQVTLAQVVVLPTNRA
jgi:NADP-dependent 3-hydroxy acid dehydrogenase YdfG